MEHFHGTLENCENYKSLAHWMINTNFVFLPEAFWVQLYEGLGSKIHTLSGQSI